MGDPAPEFMRIKNVKSYKHTFDNIEFFKNISHYVYPASRVFQDPFPHNILEAVQSGKQIIIPELPHRNHVDGIDDIKECIKWHKTFDENTHYDNSKCILNANAFRNFYLRLFENNFEHRFDKDKYKHFSDWIEHEVI